MARPKKQTVDYFPHYCNHGKTIYILEQNYGNDGYAFWFKLLEILGSTDGHYLELENPANLEFLAAKTHMDKDKCQEILDLLSRLEAIDGELWEGNRVVWSDNFVANISDAYRNRTIETPSKPSFLRKKPHSNEVIDETLQEKPTDDMRVYEMKGEESKESGKKTPSFADDHPAKILTLELKEKILSNDPKAKIPDNIDKWVLHMDRLIRLDGRSFDEIQSVIHWCQSDDFWSANILSTKKLREKFTQLKLQKERNNGTKADNNKKINNIKQLYEETAREENNLEGG